MSKQRIFSQLSEEQQAGLTGRAGARQVDVFALLEEIRADAGEGSPGEKVAAWLECGQGGPAPTGLREDGAEFPSSPLDRALDAVRRMKD